MVSGGIWASPGPTFREAFLEVEVGVGRGMGRMSPGRMRFEGGSPVDILLFFFYHFLIELWLIMLRLYLSIRKFFFDSN